MGTMPPVSKSVRMIERSVWLPYGLVVTPVTVSDVLCAIIVTSNVY